MTILVATFHSVPYHRGTWTSVRRLVAFLRSQGHVVDVLGRTPDCRGFHLLGKERLLVFPEPMASLRAMTARLPTLHLCGFELARYCLELAAAHFAVDRYDVVHAQDIASAVAVSRVRSAQTALVTTLHSYLGAEWARVARAAFVKQYLFWVERLGATCGDATLVPSERLKRLFVSTFAVPEDRIEVVPDDGLRLLAIYEASARRRTDIEGVPRKTLTIGTLTVRVPHTYQIPDAAALAVIRS